MTESQPLTPQRLDHLLLIVRDMDATLNFYTGAAGCEIHARLPEYAMVELSAGVVLVDASSPEGAWAYRGDGANLDHFCIRCAPAKEADVRAHLAKHDAAIVEERLEHGLLSLYVRDPSGNQVEFQFKPL
jgi:glyoxylase I family protein